MIEIEIDGQKLTVESGKMVIEVADNAGIYIPRFCYHKKLSIAANCRMCLVEVEKSPKPLPACATPVSKGMKVFTRSEEAISAQKAVMEFLLINHPLDCPICDQGGECELQDLAMGYGEDISRFTDRKRSVVDEDLGSLVATDMTRCIHCTRCVRFGTEVAGLSELGATGRGEHLEIGTFVKHSLKSEVSGNIIDLCPVGALTSKPFRYRARAWEMQERATIAPHDCIGSNISVNVLNKEVKRVVPRDNEVINETWISDRDRFSYEGLLSDDRISKPLVKQNNKWQEMDWEEALDFTVVRLNKVIKKHGADQIGALISPSSTIEEHYLLQQLMRGMGSQNIDHRIRQTDFSDQEALPSYPSLGISIEEIQKQDAILLVGSNIHHEQPIAGLRLRKATLLGCKAMVLNPLDFNINFQLHEKLIVSPRAMVTSLAGILKHLADLTNQALENEVKPLIDKCTPGDKERAIAEQLHAGVKVSVLLGALALNHPHAATLRSLAKLIAENSNGNFGCLTEGSNSAGAWLAGTIPHRNAAAASR